MDKFDEQTSIGRLAEQHGIDRRWLRRMALRLIAEIAPTCADSDEARSNWVAALQRAVTGLGLSYGEDVTVTSYFGVRQMRSGRNFSSRAPILPPSHGRRSTKPREVNTMVSALSLPLDGQ